jgi:hypothetical protein
MVFLMIMKVKILHHIREGMLTVFLYFVKYSLHDGENVSNESYRDCRISIKVTVRSF